MIFFHPEILECAHSRFERSNVIYWNRETLKANKQSKDFLVWCILVILIFLKICFQIIPLTISYFEWIFVLALFPWTHIYIYIVLINILIIQNHFIWRNSLICSWHICLPPETTIRGPCKNACIQVIYTYLDHLNFSNFERFVTNKCSCLLFEHMHLWWLKWWALLPIMCLLS